MVRIENAGNVEDIVKIVSKVASNFQIVDYYVWRKKGMDCNLEAG